MPRHRFALWVAWVALLGGPPASALPIPGLFATGVDSRGAPLPPGTIDPHWQLTSSPPGAPAGPAAFVVNDGYPIPPWLANGPLSRWIAPQANQSSGNPPGDYVYRLVFDLGAFDPATAVVTGRWSSDNSGVGVRLNDQPTGITFDGNFAAFSEAFVLREGFVPGLNVLEFVVNNAGNGDNPTGFRAEVSGTADPLPPAGTPPTIRRQPEDATVAPSAPASFQVDATGAPPLRYQWRFGGAPLAGATAATFTIASTTADWAGGYDVVVRNDAGAVTSRVARLDIRSPSPAERTWEPPGPSTRRTGIALAELLLHPPPRTDGRQVAFLELHNTQPFFEDLSGWRISGDFDFTFPADTLLPAHARLVVAPSPADLRAVHSLPASTPVLGGFPYRPAADRAGGIKVRKRSGGVVLELAWNGNDPAWPTPAFGPGHALVLARPSLGERNPRAWDSGSRLGGTPGEPEPVPSGPLESIAFSEILPAADPSSATAPAPFVELHNRGLARVDLSGCLLRNATLGVSFRIPDGTAIAPRGFLAFSPPDLPIDPLGGLLLLLNPEASRVLDALRYELRPAGLATGSDPDPRARWRLLQSPTPGTGNTPPAAPPVVIHEILAHPPSGDPTDEFVELHNPGPRPVDLAGWEFTDGLAFAFPAGAAIPADGYVVVVANRTLFLARHPDLDPARVFGDFTGRLSDGGERLALARPEPWPAAGPFPDDTPAFRYLVEVDDVAFADTSRWHRWSDGGGSSLELVDPRADRRLAPNWADSDETDRAPWTLVEATGPLTLGHPGVPSADQLQVLLLGAGEALVDDVEVLVNGANRVTNGTFESGTNGWFFQGTHRLSRLEPAGGFGGGRSLRLVATERGDHVANRARTALRTSIPANTPVTLRARVRWLRGHPEILLRLRNGSLEAATRLALPPFAGTPGAPNRRHLANAPPAILDVEHRPVLPPANQPVRVTARVVDPDGLRRVLLRLRTDPSAATEDVPMTDDGAGADEFAGDGIYSGRIPGRSAGTLVAFRVVAEDALAPVGVAASFPPSAGECLVRFGESVVPGAFANYRLWMTRADHDRWGAREKMSNEDVPVTFVLGDVRAIHGAGAHFAGSSYSSPGYTTPTGALCGYDVAFPDDDRFLGEDALTLDWPVRDDTDQREQLMFWFLEQYGLPNLHRRHVHLHVNGVRRGTIYDDVQQPGRDTVGEWFSDDDQGSLWKTDCWNEFDNTGSRIDPCILNTLQRFPSTGPLKTARYRWNWRPRAVRGSANDFSDLFGLVDTANTPANAGYVTAVESLVDVDHWMRTFAMNDLASYWDAFGNPNAKNTFLYKPERDRWKLMCWDFDVGLGVFNDPPTAALFDVGDPTLSRMYRTPSFVRRYWAALDEALNGFFRTGPGTRVDALLDAKYAAFRAHGIALAAPTAIKSWINQRRTYLLGQLAGVRAPFAITTRAGTDFATNREPIALAGTAPVAVRFLAVNDTVWPVDWLSVTNWSIPLPLHPGTNTLRLAGLDAYGLPVPGSTDTITVTLTGPASPPPPLRLNEWMAANRLAFPDPADGASDDWFELHHAGSTPLDLTGYTLTDDPARPRRFVVPPGFTVNPGGFLLVWADGEPDQTRPGMSLHASFRLDHDGSDLLVLDPIGRLVDAVRFGPQASDVSEGRWGDGAPGPAFPLSRPTPAAANAAPAAAEIDVAFSAALAPLAEAVVLEWTATEGRGYAVDARDDLDAATSWRSLSEWPPGPAGPRLFRDPLPPGTPERYYRIRLLP